MLYNNLLNKLKSLYGAFFFSLIYIGILFNIPLYIMNTPITLQEVLRCSSMNGENPMVTKFITKLWGQDFFPKFRNVEKGSCAFMDLANMFAILVSNSYKTRRTITYQDLSIITIAQWLRVYGKLVKSGIPLDGKKLKGKEICITLRSYISNFEDITSTYIYDLYESIELKNNKYVFGMYPFSIL